ncbi:ATP-binding protein [Frankia sp. R82]|uniref:ATP-binding protein n=1 Tax=Frankia sp. R82 TaxID=2950553 RepID=UPI00204475EC|nr:ATP-binding protein [Frankia sp. R82]MCM3887346.1 ATP-binding protein [Frankia sp. R82]
MEQLDLTPSPRLLEVLGDIPYQPWQCLAELIDNAFDDFIADEERDPQEPPTVRVTLPKSTTPKGDEIVCVADTGRGMGKEDLERSLRAGYTNNSRHGSLGLFGMGFNIATARLGTLTEVRTTRAGDADWLVAEIDFRRMEKAGSFSVPLSRQPKPDTAIHGTEVTIRKLKPETRTSLRRQATGSQIREKLGDVYSYMLRSPDSVPELLGSALIGRGFALYVNGNRVKPRLPCVWSANRYVTYRGASISAVTRIEKTLKPAWACMDCGYWHHSDPEICAECQSENLQLRERRVFGWIGLQRYFDTSDFGFDLLRNGRKIRLKDKSLFRWEHPDTGQEWTEYPIELGATVGGRFVGEVHLDHVPVTYQKNDFERSSSDWRTAVDIIRGDGPLQPKKAKAINYPENHSPLGWFFGAFREIKPGQRNLIPGDGARALHETAREWGRDFHKGLPEYRTDDRWFEAAVDHDEVKAGQRAPKQTPAARDGRPSTNLPDPDDILNVTGLSLTGSTSATSPKDAASLPRQETEEERFDRYRASARRLLDLCHEVALPNLGRREVVVYETSEPLRDGNGRETPTLARSPRGNKIEIFVDGRHSVFKECGRDPRDYAIIQLAETMRTQARINDPLAHVAADIISRLPDQRFTDSALRQRIDGLLQRTREALTSVVAIREYAIALWNCLPISEKEYAERNAEATESSLVWSEATTDGRFMAHVGPGGVAAIIRSRPDLVLDGAVFTTTWSTWPSHDAKARQVERLARRFESLAEFIANTDAKGRLDLSLTRLTLDMLDQEIKSEDLQ